MSDIFVNQDLTVILNTNITLTGASVTNILVRDPNGTTSTWTGSISGTTSISYDIPDNILATSGRWLLRASVTLSNGKIYTGEVAVLNVRSAWYNYV